MITAVLLLLSLPVLAGSYLLLLSNTSSIPLSLHPLEREPFIKNYNLKKDGKYYNKTIKSIRSYSSSSIEGSLSNNLNTYPSQSILMDP